MHWRGPAQPTANGATGSPNDEEAYTIAQANLQRKQLATNELMVEAGKRKFAIALLQEPYVGAIGRMKSYRGARIYQSTNTGVQGTVKAAIAVFQHDLEVIQYPKLTTNNIVVVRIRTSAWEITLISYYFEPNSPIEPYIQHLSNIVKEIGTGVTIVGGDANAKSTWWGSGLTDERGEDMVGALNELDLQVLNEGVLPTFDVIRGNTRYTSCVDVTACSIDVMDRVEKWRVDEGVTSSDHNTILFEIRQKRAKGKLISRTTRIFNTKKANWIDFREKLIQNLQKNNINKKEIENIKNGIDLDIMIEKYSNAIVETCWETIPEKKKKEILKLPWWNEELATLKQEVARNKRRIRCAAQIRRAKVVEEYLRVKEKYESQAKKSQIASWKAFCERQDREGLWDGIYRVLNRTAKRQEDLPLNKDGKSLDPSESASLLAETFYPDDNGDNDEEEHQSVRDAAEQVNCWTQNEILDPPFTSAELSNATLSFNPKKAPGPDGLTADICQRAIALNSDVYLTLANKCLELGHFPTVWKEATVVILRKPSREDYTNPKAYRPIGLLPVLGKILEKMLIRRIKWYIIPGLSTRQYGFMPQKSTEDSLYDLMQHIRKKLANKKITTVISLDIEGAFDSAWWPAIRIRLAEVKCPVNIRRVIDSYLRDRKVRVRYAGVECVKTTSKGCVQGSIGGPILWNLLLDPLLKGLEERGYYCQAFADDVVLVLDDNTGLDVSRRANAALAYVREWGIRNKLKFAPQKTKAMVVTNKIKYDSPLLSMGGVGIELSREIKVLGVTIDDKLTFNMHVTNTCKKVQNIYKQLSRAAKVSWGLNPQVIKTIYTAVAEPILLYAASAWAPAAKKIGIRKRLNALQRGFAQKIIKAYRTVSLNSALILAGILPLDLRIQEAAALYETKKGVFQPLLGDREMEFKARFSTQPHPAREMHLHFTNLVDREQLEVFNNQAVRIYTDGSRIEGKVGAALSIWKGEAETKALKFKLSSHCTVYQAELLALCRAASIAAQCNDNTIGIYSDSRSSLESVVGQVSLHPLVVETRDNLMACLDQNKEVALFWVKAHAGLEGNERADVLAREAALALKRKPDYDRCPVSFVKRQLRERSLEEWNRRYKSEESAGVTKVFLPDVCPAYHVVRKMEINNIDTQILTGHGGFAEYLHRFKCKDAPGCVCDDQIPESIIHLLMDCPQHDAAREDLQQELQMSLCRDSFPIIMGNASSRDVFLRFARRIARNANKRNKASHIDI